MKNDRADLIRVKEETIDNIKIKIGGLTVDQAEEYLKGAVVPSDIPDNLKNSEIAKAWLLLAYKLICMSLNNALEAEGKLTEETMWVPEQVPGRLDFKVLNVLPDKIRDWSGLRTVEVKPGESQATQEVSILMKSGVA